MVSSSRFKIAISEEGRKSVLSHFAKRASEACSDYANVSDTSDLSYPNGFQTLPKPWDQEPCTVARSTVVTNEMRNLFNLKVPGLNGDTIQDVMDVLLVNNCLSFPFGGSVRDQFLDADPNDLDMETNCDLQEVQRICKGNWDETNCKIGAVAVHIGNTEAMDGETDTIDAANWDKTFFWSDTRGICLEYTTNSLAYFANDLDIIIDLTGSGISDTCNKKIRIPVDNSDRELWSVSANEICNPDSKSSSNDKIYRFWKLRFKGYTAIDSDTLSFIVSQAKTMITNNPEGFKKFYCEKLLKGELVSGNCVNVENESCENTKKGYDDVLEEDLGTFWEDEVKPLIESLGTICSGANTPSPALSTVVLSLMSIILIAVVAIDI